MGEPSAEQNYDGLRVIAPFPYSGVNGGHGCFRVDLKRLTSTALAELPLDS